MNIVIYARYSSEKQNEQSIEGQLKECYAFAKRNDYNVVGEYIDRAMSGKTDKRPQFQKMIADSARKGFQGVLVYQLDRFARDRYDDATYKAKLKKNGARVFSAKENISDDASGIIVESLLVGMAEYYSVELSQKVERGMRLNAEKCLYNGGVVPFGYKIVDKQYIPSEETAPYVQKIFQMYADGKRAVEIVNFLNSRHIKSSQGKPFNKNSLHTMLKNKKYIGTFTYRDLEIPGGIPRLVSDELFYAVADKMVKNKKAPGRARAREEYLLTTKLFCGHCKSMMTGGSGTSSTGRKYYYYGCNHARLKKCSKKTVNKQYIEDIVIEDCRKLLTDANIAKIANEVATLCEKERNSETFKYLQAALHENEKQRKNLLDSLKICDIESVKQSIFEEIAKMEQEYRDIEDSLAQEKAQHSTLTVPDITFFLTQLKNGDANDIKYRKALIAVFVNAI